MLFIILIITSMIVIWGLNFAFSYNTYSWWYLALAVVIFTAAVIALDGLGAFIVRKLPAKWFNKDAKRNQVSKKEIKRLDALHIKAWKDKVPELGGFTDFHKDHLADPYDNTYLERFILEANYGWMCHLVNMITGIFIIFIDYKMYSGSLIWLTIGIPVFIVNFILSGMPMCALRYNLPRLNTMFKYNEKMAKRKKDKEETQE